MRVLITGGSGYIGQAVIAALVAEGHDVEALLRDASDASVVSDIGADQQFTARRARDELGWIPREAGVLEYLADSAVAA